MTIRRLVWLLFLTLFAGLLVAYAVWLVGSWKRSDGSGWEEAAATFAIVGVPGLAAALNVGLIHYTKRGLCLIAALAAGTAVAALVFATFVPISGFVAVIAAIVLMAIAATAVFGSYRSRGDAMMSAASIALLVSAGIAMLTWGGGLPISLALLIVAAATMNVARVNRLVPPWPIVLIIVLFVFATSGIALVVVVPVAVVAAAIVVFRRRGLKQRVHVAEDRGD